ncbi:hypothetical protein L0F63_000543 [Massospora cicadina]|nr:hypothetical protein L0F63_000543 [Massospora cicadina]
MVRSIIDPSIRLVAESSKTAPWLEQHLSALTLPLVGLASIVASATSGSAHQRDLERPHQGKLSPSPSHGSYHISTHIYNHMAASVPSLTDAQAPLSKSKG